MSGSGGTSSGGSQTGFRGTPYEANATARANEAGEMANNWARQVQSSPNTFMGQTGQQLYGSGQYGLGFNVDPAIREYSKQMYSLASGTGAARGRLTPEGAEAAAGDAITQSLPSLIPQLMQFGQWQFQLPMNLNTYASNIFNQNAGTQNQGLGGTESRSSDNFGFGLLSNYSGSSSSSRD